MSLEVSGLSHSYGARRVLDDVSFSVAQGEVFGLLGPNGCGKSTTLRALTGLLSADAGQFKLGGEAVEAGGRSMRGQIGVVFQSPSLDLRLTAIENLMLSAALYGVPPQEAARRAEDLLAVTELTDRASDRVLEFSGGMRRRLELVRALLHRPSLLIMDEPTSGLDERAFRRTWERILQLRDEGGLSVLFTTHRAEEAQLCDRVAILDGGGVIAQDTPDNLRERVAGDVLSIEAQDPDALATELSGRFEVEAKVVEGRVVIERERGHELIPRIVESLPKGRIASLSMHRPTLADVFVQLTGRSLGDDTEPTDG